MHWLRVCLRRVVLRVLWIREVLLVLVLLHALLRLLHLPLGQLVGAHRLDLRQQVIRNLLLLRSSTSIHRRSPFLCFLDQ
jgi:hypothetical protein